MDGVHLWIGRWDSLYGHRGRGSVEMLKKVLVWGGIAFVVFFVAFRPGAARDVVATLGATAIDIFTAVGMFFESLVS